MTSKPEQSTPDGHVRDEVAARAIEILDSQRIMSVSTVRPDGWPQTTLVGYANDGLSIYFMVMRSSQKLANILSDGRISLAVGQEPTDIGQAIAVYSGALAAEVQDELEREDAWRLLARRHTNLAGYELPDKSAAAVIRARCKFVSVVDYSKGLGHHDSLTVDGDVGG